MKTKIGLLIMLMVMLVLATAGCMGNRVEGPAIKFNKQTYNFGQVDEGEQVKYTYTFSNPGSETLIIENVHPTCGCTVTGEYDKEIKPGGRGKIPVVLNTHGYQGDVVKTIRVETNTLDPQPIQLTLEGNIRVLVEINPRVLWLGNPESKGTSLAGSMTIKNNLNKPMQITELLPSNIRTGVKLITIEQDKEYRIDITVNPPLFDGHVRETVTVKTNLKEKPEIELAYSYYLPPLLDVNPKEIYIQPEYIQETAQSRVITIQSRLEQDIEISKVSIHGKNIEYFIEEINPGKAYHIVLRFNPGFTFPEKDFVYVTFQIMHAPDNPVFTILIKEPAKN
jgi:hypothetical protein